MDLLAERQQSLEGFSDLMGLLREIDAVVSEMESMKVRLPRGPSLCSSYQAP